LEWQRQRETRLTAEDGWLTLAGLFWLEKPVSTVGSAPDSDVPLPAGAPAAVGTLTREGGGVQLALSPGVEAEIDPAPAGDPSPVPLAGDRDGKPTLVRLGAVSFHLIDRGDKVGVRVRDREHPNRKNFAGLEFYPAAPAFHLTARLEPAPAGKTLPILNVLGMVEDTPSPGTLVFEHGGETYRLDALDGGDELFVIFADATNDQETYGAGRYLYVPRPAAGTDTVELDFNRAYTPPCGFTAFATCPLPPPQNRLPFPVTAGERYTGHAGSHG
jgi:uncharacterized protein (DUF1684 family)